MFNPYLLDWTLLSNGNGVHQYSVVLHMTVTSVTSAVFNLTWLMDPILGRKVDFCICPPQTPTSYNNFLFFLSHYSQVHVLHHLPYLRDNRLDKCFVLHTAAAVWNHVGSRCTAGGLYTCIKHNADMFCMHACASYFYVWKVESVHKKNTQLWSIFSSNSKKFKDC